MLWPCEEFARAHLPIIRACVAKRLVQEYGLSQQEAAQRLGLTQAAVSKALSQYKQKIRKAEADPKLRELISRLAEGVAAGEPDALKICESCEHLLGKTQCRRGEKPRPAKVEAGYT